MPFYSVLTRRTVLAELADMIEPHRVILEDIDALRQFLSTLP
jgi:hypothetical protein